jgi:hypothetical protein
MGCASYEVAFTVPDGEPVAATSPSKILMPSSLIRFRIASIGHRRATLLFRSWSRMSAEPSTNHGPSIRPSRRSRRDGIAVTVRTERCPPTPGLLEATCADGHAVDCRVRVKPCLSGAHTVEVALLPSTVTRVAIDPDQALADVDRAGSVWTASD